MFTFRSAILSLIAFQLIATSEVRSSTKPQPLSNRPSPCSCPPPKKAPETQLSCDSCGEGLEDCACPTGPKVDVPIMTAPKSCCSDKRSVPSAPVAKPQPPMTKEDPHDCQMNKKGTGKGCSGKSCAHCTCKDCTCPHRPKAKRDAEENSPTLPENPNQVPDFFSFLLPSFRQKTVDFIQQNPQVFEYLPISFRQTVMNGLRSEFDPNERTFVEKAREKYTEMLDFLPDFTGVSNFLSEKVGNHTARVFKEEGSAFDNFMSAKLCAKERLTPILFVPGLLGSALEERRTNATGLPAECYRSSAEGESEWSRSWVSVASFLGFRCWNEVLKLSIVDEPIRHHADVPSNGFTMNIKENRSVAASVSRSVKGFFATVRSIFAPNQESTVEQLDASDGRIPTATVNLHRASSKGMSEAIGVHSDFSHRFLKSKFPPGVEVRPLDDGIEATRCLDSSNSWTCQTTSYFKNLLSHVTKSIVMPARELIDDLEPEVDESPNNTATTMKSRAACPQYVLRKNIDVVPFDFRLGGYELYNSMYATTGKNVGEYGGFFEKVKAKVEQLYDTNGGAKVAMVTHSLGGPLTLAFLNTYVDEEWKERYIKKVVTIAAPFAGAIKALQSTLLGESESFLIPSWSTQSLLSSWPGIYMVFPTNPSKKERASEASPILVEVHADIHREIATPSLFDRIIGSVRDFFVAQVDEDDQRPARSTRQSPDVLNTANYVARDLPQILRMHPNIPNIYAEHLERLRPLFDVFREPPTGVDIDCIYSTGIKTTKKLIYKTFAKTDVFAPEIVTDDEGDGTVRLESLGLCRSWQTDADIDVDMRSNERVDLFEAFETMQTPRSHDAKRPIRRTVQLEGVNHVDIITNAPDVWDFILRSVNAE